MSTKLSVNLNKIALLRNARGRDYPSVEYFAERCIAYGAHGITLHPRPDQRHARFSDVASQRALTRRHHVEFNVEGYPSADFMDLVLAHRPDQCTLVPDAPEQVTSDHGWNVQANVEMLAGVVQRLRAAGIRSSLFMDADDLQQISLASELGADRIELYTENYAQAFGSEKQAAVLQAYRAAAVHAQALGLGVNAGHDLNQQNLAAFVQQVPGIAEVSIGHALVVEALEQGWQTTIENYVRILSA